MTAPISDQTASVMRQLWFDYLDTIEPIRPRLHRFCVKLTGSIWDGEDLLQDTLLRGFGSIARDPVTQSPELGARRWFDKPQGYLSQIAVNLWIDQRRRAQREFEFRAMDIPATTRETPVVTRSAGTALFDRTSPQERAALVLKEVFDFDLSEIAQLLSTTEGAIKTALHRARKKLSDERNGGMPHRLAKASAELVDRFVVALNTRDVEKITALLLEPATYEVQGVGWERGKRTIWLGVATNEARDVTAERRFVDGEFVVVHTFVANGKTYLGSVARLEESEEKVARIINYHYCPDTLVHVARLLELEPWSNGYHQTDRVLAQMVMDSALPWGAVA